MHHGVPLPALIVALVGCSGPDSSPGASGADLSPSAVEAAACAQRIERVRTFLEGYEVDPARVAFTDPRMDAWPVANAAPPAHNELGPVITLGPGGPELDGEKLGSSVEESLPSLQDRLSGMARAFRLLHRSHTGPLYAYIASPGESSATELLDLAASDLSGYEARLLVRAPSTPVAPPAFPPGSGPHVARWVGRSLAAPPDQRLARSTEVLSSMAQQCPAYAAGAQRVVRAEASTKFSVTREVTVEAMRTCGCEAVDVELWAAAISTLVGAAGPAVGALPLRVTDDPEAAAMDVPPRTTVAELAARLSERRDIRLSMVLRRMRATSRSHDTIQRTVGSHLSEVARCYQARLEEVPDLSIRVLLRIVIDPSGDVTRAIHRDDGHPTDTIVGRCVTAAAHAWRFLPDDDSTIVNYPFVLEPLP